MKTLLILLFLALLQSGEAQITVTLLDDASQPIVGQTISFASEQQEVLASCMTNANGRCTMILYKPTDALIRGTLITEHGQRPVIFKGQSFEVTLTLNEADQLHIPSDAYVTRTPQNRPVVRPETTAQPETTATTTTQPEATATYEPETTATTTVQPETTATTTAQPETTATTTAQPETTVPDLYEQNGLYFWLQLSLIIILMAAVMLYIWSSQKQSQP